MIWRLLKRLVFRMKQGTFEAQDHEVTARLNEGVEASRESQDRLAAQLYPELKRIARARFRSERSDHTLQPTALVNELYLQLLRRSDVTWTSRKHFLLAASKAMHHLLVDHARAKRAEKRGGSWQPIEIEDPGDKAAEGSTIEALELDGLMAQLAEKEPRMAKIVELRFFGGLTLAEIGEVLGIDERTVKRDWALARAWLRGHLDRNEGGRVGED
jgi:RNA polymerase sigma factor (TIGR02999 family)